MGRYSDIRRGAELNAALVKLRAYEDLSRDQKQALYKTQRGSLVKVKANRVKGYVEAFGFTGRIFLPVKLLSTTQSANGTLIGTVRTAAAAEGRTNAVDFTVPSGGVLLDGLNGFKPAKLSLTERGAPVANNKSRVTDEEYQRFDNKSVSSPFGQGTDTETYAAAVADIKAQSAIESFLQTTGNRVSFTPEIL
ncbi:hypothetical protein ACX27_01820 [Nostoc piscinale CENA21]|uniref:Uncharacterized protein n=1 Tax=Nostoc piscinale CENA21 TaxID=224013 RepID=A0A0M3V4F9_9NOSO|nr:hypothetical protein [Nostoc piscinale]ALF51867.1 hypothetical protein ACX27_01820 [Nostoc piscinale CENA21]